MREETLSQLFRPPRLTDTKPKFQPSFELSPGTICSNCKNPVPKSDGDFCESVKVCRDCLQVYSVVSAVLNKRTEVEQQSNGRSEIICGKCRTIAPLEGYQFMLVAICGCCRNERAAEIAGNRFKRRMNKREG